jgi:hypothetical protein
MPSNWTTDSLEFMRMKKRGAEQRVSDNAFRVDIALLEDQQVLMTRRLNAS